VLISHAPLFVILDSLFLGNGICDTSIRHAESSKWKKI